MWQEKIQLAIEPLASLTPDEIAEWMRIQGIHGKSRLARSCPLAMYFQNATGEVTAILSGVATRKTESVRLPINLIDFYHRFDNGFYPDLIA